MTFNRSGCEPNVGASVENLLPILAQGRYSRQMVQTSKSLWANVIGQPLAAEARRQKGDLSRRRKNWHFVVENAVPAAQLAGSASLNCADILYCGGSDWPVIQSRRSDPFLLRPPEEVNEPSRTDVRESAGG